MFRAQAPIIGSIKTATAVPGTDVIVAGRDEVPNMVM